ncbi:MAG: imelysin family protein [Tabrizicola sp.]|uniref:imelysin family protein n=1 Tax=Tabrizicola sp. TaxID=2005166 RepID=UPI00273762D1|nr:imelysin family protein [Tabrizicola sp.]MDP3261535.1 imelysin family protein [Tabrizicola sp.]MDP3648396.1 imelysin family protein [Paracoccaceae bacterium]MDZ4065368.1 imelysin family protein [Tabrizicola sp.]
MTRLFAASLLSATLCTPVLAAEPAEVLSHYADMAAATYGDSLTAAKTLQAAVSALIATPSDTTLQAAKAAWIAARAPYQQTEAFRFANPVVDDWEGRVNSWPLDEGLIDYVATGSAVNEENDLATLNVIATPTFTLSGAEVDATTITPALISGSLHEAGGIEANVASGYHAIEFMLWGQDLNGTGPGAGARPFTDYAQGAGCTNGNCDRRAAYLQAATDLLVSDLDYIVAQWADDGAARKVVTTDPQTGLLAMLTGMGSLSYGELAGERMKLGLMLNDPEEEQDCFSDNTHNSHYFDGVGIRNVYTGSYTRMDGTTLAGPSLSDLVAAADPAVDMQLKAELDASVAALMAVKTAAAGGLAYDQMLEAGNATGEALIMGAVDALVTQTASIERAVTALGLSKPDFEGSESLDNPDAIFQ